jgi:hypothetical protein
MQFYDAAEKKATKITAAAAKDGAFPCSPEDQANSCQLRFEIHPDHAEYTNKVGTSRSYVENQCKCALDGKLDSGYCSTTLGTDKYKKAV